LRSILGCCRRGASIVGLERDPRWVAEANRRREGREGSARFRFDQGVAEALPYEDETFDLVTCQTLLMHIGDPVAVIGEMVRVSKRGGLVLAAEPNNRASFLVETSFSAHTPLEGKVEAIRFLLVYERGKMLPGEGNNSVGDMLPGGGMGASVTNVDLSGSSMASGGDGGLVKGVLSVRGPTTLLRS
jgi:SAM-dependent methyltransferase